MMHTRDETPGTKKIWFLLALLASLILHGLIFFYFQKLQKTENIIKTESVEVLFLNALKNTEAVREISSNSGVLDFKAEIESQRIEKEEISLAGPFLEDISKRTTSTRLEQNFIALIKNNIAKTSKLEKNLNNRILTVSNSEELPIHARLYLNSWEKKIEKIGNLNYPKNATDNRLYGSLELLVSILPSGELGEIRLLESSGHLILDKAAISIVKMASPFAPFPEEMTQGIDLLEITRIWDFRKSASWSFKENARNR